MATRKKSSKGTSYPSVPSAQMKFQSQQNVTRSTAKGIKPLPDPTSISESLSKVIVYVCKKILFLPPRIRLTGYAVLLFFASLVADYLPFPKTYFADSANIPNQYFVKFSWAWTLILVGVFMFLTASVYCGGQKKRLIRHYARLLVGTVIWFTWTNIFRIVEEATGQCHAQGDVLYSIRGKKTCSSKGGRWMSFDISGHAFLLMWCVLTITEESKAIIGWDYIKDFIRNEEYNRTRASLSASPTNLFTETPLSHLSSEDFEIVKKNYSQFATVANVQLVFLTLLVLLWDLMIAATAIYFHTMIEKVIGGLIAALMWFWFYRGVYTWNISLNPGLPGLGIFKYSKLR